MDTVITEYQKWKQQGERLRTEARQAIEVRYRELLIEAANLAQVYQADFGGVLKPPPPVTAFRYKARAKARAKKPGKAAPVEPVIVVAPASSPARRNPKITALEKKLAGAKKKLDAAKASGANTKNLEDRVYEIEDDLRLATQST